VRFTYDAVGNRLTEARNGVSTVNYTYNPLQQLTQRGTSAYTYDANGNQTAAGSRTFSWNTAGQLTSSTLSGTTVTYTYDGNGNRLTASMGAGAANTTKSSWDVNNPLPMLFSEKDGNNALLRRYAWGRDVIAMTTPAGAFYLHHDDLGSATSLTSTTGVTQWTRSFEPFGVKRSETKNVPTAPVLPLQYTGENLDPTTGLYNLRARHLDTVAGRFTSYDPVGETATSPYSSDYAYVSNRATVWADPSGECPEWLCGNPAVKVVRGVLDVPEAAVVGAWNFGYDVIVGFKQTVTSCYHDPVACGKGIVEIYQQCGQAVVGHDDYRGLGRLCFKAVLTTVGIGKAAAVTATVARNLALRGAAMAEAEGGWAPLPVDETGAIRFRSGSNPPWSELLPFRGAIKTNGLSGRDRRYYTLDRLHGEVEVFDRKGKHIGAMDTVTGELIKPAVPGRSIAI
jgi:RHS repeat-associated protein